MERLSVQVAVDQPAGQQGHASFVVRLPLGVDCCLLVNCFSCLLAFKVGWLVGLQFVRLQFDGFAHCLVGWLCCLIALFVFGWLVGIRVIDCWLLVVWFSCLLCARLQLVRFGGWIANDWVADGSTAVAHAWYWLDCHRRARLCVGNGVVGTQGWKCMCTRNTLQQIVVVD